MIEALGRWIITICVAVFFSTAVQMILPDNSLKKYCNFVLGLIVFVVMITPIVNLFNKDIEIGKLIEDSALQVFSEDSSQNYEEYRNSNIDSTLTIFKEKLEKQCVQDLKEQFSGDDYKVNVDVSYDSENSLFIINSVDIGINDGSVKRVEEVVIGDAEAVPVHNGEEELGERATEVKEYISSRYDVNMEKIYIYKSVNSGNKG